MKSDFRHLGIRLKLIASFLVMILPIFLLGFISQKLTYNALKENVVFSTNTTVELSAKLLEKIFSNTKAEYLRVLLNREIQDYFSYRAEENNSLSLDRKKYLKNKANKYLTNQAFSSTFISKIRIFTNDSDTSLGLGGYSQNYDFSKIKNAQWFIRGFKRSAKLEFYGFHSELDKGNYENNYAMALTGSVKKLLLDNFIDETIGVMVMDIDDGYLDKVLSEIKLGEKGEIHLFTSDDRDITPGRTISTRIINIQPGQELFYKTGDIMGNSTVQVEGDKYFVSYHGIKGTDLLIVGLQPESDIVKVGRHINMITALLILFAIATAIILGLIITFGIGGRISRFSITMEKVANGDLNVNLPTGGGDEISILAEGFNKMVQELKWYINKSIENEKVKREMEINLLISQINPHVIYNTLNSVIYLAKEKRSSDVVKMVESFISLLHDSIKIGDEALFATIKQEIKSINDYVTIQHFRYPDKFTVQWEVDNSLLDFKIPRTIIQPLVENALFHGICPLESAGIIRIYIKSTDDYLSIIVSDNGEGMDSERLEELMHTDENELATTTVKSIGLMNIKERIEYFYAGKGAVIINSIQGEGTKVEIRIPLEK